MGMEFRPYYLAKEWKLAGHNVTIIAASHSHIRQKQPTVVNNFTEEDIDGIPYIWIKTPKYEGNSSKRVLNMFHFTKYLFFNAKMLATKYKPDAVIASSTYPTDNYVAHKIAKHAQAKYFYEIHDLWPLSPMELGNMSKLHPFILLMQHAENYAYKHCDSVVSILPKTLEHTIQHGLSVNKWFCVPNGIVVNEWNQSENLTEQEQKSVEKIKKQNKYTVAYAGTVGLANGLDAFIDAAKSGVNLPVSYIIVGKGPETVRLKQRKVNEMIENLHFLDAVAKTKIPTLLNYFDFLYIGLKRESLFRFGISPNKIFDYMMAGKPIIQAIEAGNNPVVEAGCGISIEPETPKEINIALNTLCNLTESQRLKFGENGRNYVLQHHDYSVLAKKFLDIMQK